MQRSPLYHDSVILVFGHSRISEPYEQKPIPPNMTFITACLMNEKLRFTDPRRLFNEFRQLFTTRFIKLNPTDSMASRRVKPDEDELNRALVHHRSKDGFAAVCADPGDSTKCTIIPSIFTMTKNEQALTVQDCFLEGDPLPIQGIFMINNPNVDSDITAEIIGMRPFVNVALPNEEAIIHFERWFFFQHKRNPTDDEVFQVVQENIADLREKRTNYLKSMNFPLCNLQKYNVSELQELSAAIMSAISQNPQFVDQTYYDNHREQINDAIWNTFSKDLKSKTYIMSPDVSQLVFKEQWHELSTPKYFTKPSDHGADVDIFDGFVYTLLQKLIMQRAGKFEPIKSDILLERIRAHCPGNLYIVFIGCRGRDVPGNPTHSPRNSGPKFNFGGTKTPKRRAKIVKRIKRKYSKKHIIKKQNKN